MVTNQTGLTLQSFIIPNQKPSPVFLLPTSQTNSKLPMAKSPALLLLLVLTISTISHAFQSDELLLHDDDEFEGFSSSPPPPAAAAAPPLSRRRADPDASMPAAESNAVQFALEHDLGDSDGFAGAGAFTARLKSWSHGGQTLTKLRFLRNALTEEEKEAFKKLLKEDGFYTIRLPSNVLNPTGKDYVVSSIKARCIPRESLDEHIVIHTDGVNILAVNYGAVGGCQYPRQMKLPAKWLFNSYTVLKTAEQAPRTPSFAEQLVEAENGLGEIMKPPEKSFWAKYWMYIIPLGLIVMNAFTAAMNMPEEQASGQGQQPGAQRVPNAAVRRR